MILEQLGKKDAAQDAFKKAVAIDPDHKEAKAKLPAPKK
jgi:Tfp pilus assembly protein PilF